VIEQVSGGFCHAPRPAGGAKATLRTGESHELLMGTIGATQAQKTVG